MNAPVDLLGTTLATRGGMGTHQSAMSINEVWLTPPPILKALGPFDLDPCACPDPRPWEVAKRHFGKAENGLTRAWEGRVFLNPPYGGPSIVGPWMKRLVQHGRGTALIFARTETEVFHETVWGAASALLFLRGRLHFHHADGRRSEHNAGAPSVLIAYGEDDSLRLEASGLGGKFLRILK